MRSYLALIFAVISIGSSFSQTTTAQINSLRDLPLVNTFTPSDYGAGIQNWDITQDTVGYFYFANNYGLLEYDGASWHNYTVTGGTKTRSVLVQEKTNRIYIGGQKQLGYFLRNSAGLEYYDLKEKFPLNVDFDEVWSLVAFEDLIYANIKGRLYKLEEDSITEIENLIGIEFLTKVEDQIIATSIDGIYIKDKDSDFTKISNAGNQYRGVIKQGRSHFLFTYDGEILRLQNGEVSKYLTSNDDFLQTSKINQVLHLSDGNIVIATQNDGLVITDPQLHIVQHLTKNRGLNHRTVISLYEDPHKNLWVGLNNGICVIDLGSPFSLLNENVGLEGTGYVARKYRDQIYLGTSSGLFYSPTIKNALREDDPYQLVQGSAGLVNNISIVGDELIVGHHEGAFHLTKDSVRPFYQNTGTWEFKNFPDSRVIGGTYKGLILSDNNYRNVKELKGLSESSRILQFENDSTLWMTHGYKGAFRVQFTKDSIRKISRYGASEGFPSDILITVYQIGGDLIFTGESGIYVFDRHANLFKRHPFLNKWFQDKHVSKIIESPNGHIYYIANGEMGVLKKKSIGIYEQEEKQFRKINRFISDDLENINIIDDDHILIGAKEGFVLYQPKLDGMSEENFEAYLKAISIVTMNDKFYQVDGLFFTKRKIERSKRIRFDFSSPYYDGLGDLKFSYRLKPYEEEWSDWSGVNWEEYTNLPAKDYVFELKALDVYGNESKISTYSFTITPQWYESRLALIAYAITVFLIFIAVIAAREKKHNKEKIHLYRTKEDEIKSREREISEFSQKTSRQIQTLQNESLQKEIEHKNSQLASVTMHLLSKNEFVSTIRTKLDQALNSRDNKAELEKIIRSIDQNVDEDEAWETFANHFDQVHGNFLHKIKRDIHLTPQETKLCAYLKMNMSTKDIANLMNITVRGVELARYRLRKKLKITRETNLVEYLDSY